MLLFVCVIIWLKQISVDKSNSKIFQLNFTRFSLIAIWCFAKDFICIVCYVPYTSVYHYSSFTSRNIIYFTHIYLYMAFQCRETMLTKFSLVYESSNKVESKPKFLVSNKIDVLKWMFFFNWDSNHARLKQPLQGTELQEKENQKD